MLVPATTVPRAAVPVAAAPPCWMEQPAIAVLDVPVLVSVTTHSASVASAALEHSVTVALTAAELVNDPNRPNTNPAMAIAAMRVMAIRMTVASTGEMALFLVFRLMSKRTKA